MGCGDDEGQGSFRQERGVSTGSEGVHSGSHSTAGPGLEVQMGTVASVDGQAGKAWILECQLTSLGS